MTCILLRVVHCNTDGNVKIPDYKLKMRDFKKINFGTNGSPYERSRDSPIAFLAEKWSGENRTNRTGGAATVTTDRTIVPCAPKRQTRGQGQSITSHRARDGNALLKPGYHCTRNRAHSRLFQSEDSLLVNSDAVPTVGWKQFRMNLRIQTNQIQTKSPGVLILNLISHYYRAKYNSSIIPGKSLTQRLP